MWWSLLISALIITLISVKCYIKFSTRWNNSYKCLVGKTVIITGANSGIGYYTALDFAKRGARVILACRNKHKSEEAKQKIIEATRNENIEIKIINLASLHTIRHFAKQINEAEERLDILVNNAGVAGYDNAISKDGLNMIMQVNHFGPFLLTLLLLDLLKKSAPSKIINVSSSMAFLAKLDPDNLNAVPKGLFKNMRLYANSKLCNILFTNELARKLRGANIQVNSVHPGVCNTELLRYSRNGIASFISNFVVKIFYKTAEEGAQTPIYMAISNDVEDITGHYFENCKIGWFPGMPITAHDGGLARIVWEKSEELVKLSDDERTLPGNPVIVVTTPD